MRKLVIVLAFLLSASNIYAQQSVVEKYRGKYPTPIGATNTIALLKEVASEVKGGILRKPDGNNCNGYSCDIICFSNGTLYDVLSDSEGAARPTWNPAGTANPSRCELVTVVNPVPEPTPDNPPPPIQNTDAVVEKLDKLIQLQTTQILMLQKALSDLQDTIKQGVKIKF